MLSFFTVEYLTCCMLLVYVAIYFTHSVWCLLTRKARAKKFWAGFESGQYSLAVEMEEIFSRYTPSVAHKEALALIEKLTKQEEEED